MVEAAKSSLAAWADKHLIPEWRQSTKLWTVQLDIFISIGGTLITLLTLMSENVQNILGPWKFAIIFAVVSAVRLGLRLWKQKITGRDMGDDDAG